MTDLEERLYVSRVRDFYKDLLGFGGVNLFLLGVWGFLSPSWYFWPGWVMIGWGLLLGRRAMDLGLWSCKTTQFSLSLPFMSPEWEKKQLAKLRSNGGCQSSNQPSASQPSNQLSTSSQSSAKEDSPQDSPSQPPTTGVSS